MISILVPLDGSKLAEEMLPCVEELASRLHAEVRFLQVVDPRVESGIFTAEAGFISRRVEEDIRESESYLIEIADGWRAKDIDAKWEVMQGIPARCIIQSARAHKCTLIAMSTHGRSGLSRMVFGSVADEVLRESGIPVLLVKPCKQSAHEPVRLWSAAGEPIQQNETRTVA